MKVKDSGKLALLEATGYRSKASIDAANKQLAHFVELLEASRTPQHFPHSLRCRLHNATDQARAVQLSQ